MATLVNYTCKSIKLTPCVTSDLSVTFNKKLEIPLKRSRSSEPREGPAVCRAKAVPSFLSCF